MGVCRRFCLRIRGFLALYCSATIFAFVSLAVRFASQSFPGLFVSASRFAVGIPLCLAGMYVLGKKGHPFLPAKPGLIAARGFFGAVSMAMTYMAISLSGPGRATLLSNTYPLFVSIFGSLFFGERFKPSTVLSVGICTIGALFVVGDGSGSSLTGDLLALGSAVFAGVAVNFVRKASQFDSPFVLYLAPCVFGLALFLFAPVPEGGLTGSGAVGLISLLVVGAGAFGAQILMAWGYRSVPASAGSVVFYWETALTVLLGTLVAGESFNLRFAGGLALTFAGLWLNGRQSLPARITR